MVNIITVFLAGVSCHVSFPKGLRINGADFKLVLERDVRHGKEREGVQTMCHLQDSFFPF